MNDRVMFGDCCLALAYLLNRGGYEGASIDVDHAVFAIMNLLEPDDYDELSARLLDYFENTRGTKAEDSYVPMTDEAYSRLEVDLEKARAECADLLSYDNVTFGSDEWQKVVEHNKLIEDRLWDETCRKHGVSRETAWAEVCARAEIE